MPSPILGYLIVFLGGGIGAGLRHAVNRLAMTVSPNFPAGTLCINVLGCFLMGLCTAWFACRGAPTSGEMRLLLTTGLLGGFTTFSAFSLDAVLLWQRGEAMQAAVYVLASVIVSLLTLVAGMALMRAMLS